MMERRLFLRGRSSPDDLSALEVDASAASVSQTLQEVVIAPTEACRPKLAQNGLQRCRRARRRFFSALN